MNKHYENIRVALETRDLSNFLTAFEAMVAGRDRPENLTPLTQRVLPAVLRGVMAAQKLTDEEVVRLWRLVRSEQLILVDNDLREAINARLDAAVRSICGEGTPPPAKLLTYSDEPAPKRRRFSSPATPPPSAGPVVELTRVVIAGAFTIGSVGLSDMMSFKKNVCASSQEREFLKAVRQFFPNLRAYPNVPLRNFIDVDGFISRLSERHRGFAWTSQVDVLLCTDDEDPVACFELDSVHHDAQDRRDRDQLKTELFAAANIPLVRIRADETGAVRAEDFYDLLTTQTEDLDKLRPRRLRPRRNHDALVPAEMRAVTTAVRR